MVSDEDGFYAAFTSGDPARMTLKIIGNFRKEIFEKAIKKSGLEGLVDAGEIISIIFDADNSSGLYLFFQHAVHLITEIASS